MSFELCKPGPTLAPAFTPARTWLSDYALLTESHPFRDETVTVAYDSRGVRVVIVCTASPPGIPRKESLLTSLSTESRTALKRFVTGCHRYTDILAKIPHAISSHNLCTSSVLRQLLLLSSPRLSMSYLSGTASATKQSRHIPMLT